MKFRSATDLDDALSILADRGVDATVIAGGTNVMVQMGRKELDTGFLLHIERLEDLKGVAVVGGGVRIGALTSHRALAVHPYLAENYASICSAAASVGGWQTQCVGTIGGNICNASPAADLVPSLLVHDAEVSLSSQSRGGRSLPLGEFLLGRREIGRQPDELLTHIDLKTVPARTADVYLKVGRRSAMEVAIVGLAVRLTMSDEDAVIEDARIATCATGPAPCRAEEAEAVLNGQPCTSALIERAGEALREAVNPIDDVRGTAAYRLAVLPRLLGRAVKMCRERIEDIP